MNNQYQYSGKRLTMTMARELIIEFFEGQTVAKQDMIRKIDQVHLERGGKLSENKVHPVTDALNVLKRKELANNPNPGDGIWTIFEETADEGIDDVDDENGDESDDGVKYIGSGDSSVYVYYYPAYKELAESRGEETWPCKIGHSVYPNPIHRILEQARTGFPEKPEIVLVIQTNQPKEVEDAIHSLLDSDHMPDALGKEWFITNPSRVEKIYQIISQNYS